MSILIEGLLVEEKFLYRSLSPEQQEKLYQLFKDSYIKSTGNAWNEYKFAGRAKNWTFYGDPEKGGIAVREQKSGLVKLVASFGEPRAVIEAVQELVHTNKKPIRGVLPSNLARHLRHAGFKVATYEQLMKMKPYVEQSGVIGDEIESVKPDGTIVVKNDFGSMDKVLVGNDKYFDFLSLIDIANPHPKTRSALTPASLLTTPVTDFARSSGLLKTLGLE